MSHLLLRFRFRFRFKVKAVSAERGQLSRSITSVEARTPNLQVARVDSRLPSRCPAACSNVRSSSSTLKMMLAENEQMQQEYMPGSL